MAIAIGAAIAVAATVISHEVSGGGAAASGGSGGGFGAAAGGNGLGVGNKQSNFNDTQNAAFGVQVSGTPTIGDQALPQAETMTSARAPAPSRAATDYQGIWADKMAKYQGTTPDTNSISIDTPNASTSG